MDLNPTESPVPPPLPEKPDSIASSQSVSDEAATTPLEPLPVIQPKPPESPPPLPSASADGNTADPPPRIIARPVSRSRREDREEDRWDEADREEEEYERRRKASRRTTTIVLLILLFLFVVLPMAGVAFLFVVCTSAMQR